MKIGQAVLEISQFEYFGHIWAPGYSPFWGKPEFSQNSRLCQLKGLIGSQVLTQNRRKNDDPIWI